MEPLPLENYFNKETFKQSLLKLLIKGANNPGSSGEGEGGEEGEGAPEFDAAKTEELQSLMEIILKKMSAEEEEAEVTELLNEVPKLINEGANVNSVWVARPGDGELISILMFFIDFRVWQMVEELIENGADAKATVGNVEGGVTVLERFVEWVGVGGSYNELTTGIIKALINAGADVNYSDRESTALHSIVSDLTRLEGIGPPDEEQHLMEIVDILIKAGVDINKKDENKQTITDLVEMLSDETWKSEILTKIGEAQGLILLKVMATYKDQGVNGVLENVKELIVANADVNMQQPFNGDTPLHMAVEEWWHRLDPVNKASEEEKEGAREIVKILIDAKANVNIENKIGVTALNIVMKMKDDALLEIDDGVPRVAQIVEMLIYIRTKELNNAAKVLQKVGDNEEDERVIELIKSSGMSFSRDVHITLNKALQFIKYNIVEALIEANVDVNMQLSEGNTLLHIAIKKLSDELWAEHGKSAYVQGAMKIVKILITKGNADVTITNDAGKVALEILSYDTDLLAKTDPGRHSEWKTEIEEIITLLREAMPYEDF